jgi:hypothetical protein
MEVCLYLLEHQVMAQYRDFVVRNIACSASTGFAVNIKAINLYYQIPSSYKPSSFPGMIFRITKPSISFIVFVSGKCIVTGANRYAESWCAWRWLYINVLRRFRARDAHYQSSAQYYLAMSRADRNLDEVIRGIAARRAKAESQAMLLHDAATAAAAVAPSQQPQSTAAAAAASVAAASRDERRRNQYANALRRAFAAQLQAVIGSAVRAELIDGQSLAHTLAVVKREPRDMDADAGRQTVEEDDDGGDDGNDDDDASTWVTRRCPAPTPPQGLLPLRQLYRLDATSVGATRAGPISGMNE